MGKLTRRKRRNNNSNNNHNNHSINDDTLTESSEENGTEDKSWFQRMAPIISRGVFQFAISWLIIGILANYMSYNKTDTTITSTLKEMIQNTTVTTASHNEHRQLNTLTNTIQIEKKELESFHAIIKFPKVWNYEVQQQQDDVKDNVTLPNKSISKKKLKQFLKYNVLDFTSNVNGTILHQVGGNEEETNSNSLLKEKNPWQKVLLSVLNIRSKPKKQVYSIGRYNELRRGMYTTQLFQNNSYQIDGYHGDRILHIGIDIYAPSKTNVYSFADGVIHSFGYNAAQGDYGHVIVVEYNVTTTMLEEGRFCTLWALYGHLSKRSIQGKSVGQSIPKGGIVGYIGDIHENGGWENPHVHFQLSRNNPKTHDMPGVVSLQDKERALIDYPDPLIVLGPLY